MILAIVLAATLHCGVERQDVKVGSDWLAAYVNFKPKPATIPALRTARPPQHIKKFKGRYPGIEDQVFYLEAWVAYTALEADGDYHIVLVDESGESIIAEIPDPRCVPETSPFRHGIETSRAEFQALGLRNGPIPQGHRPRVRVVGPGFFDFIHGQVGHAPNGIEIHPVEGFEVIE